MSRNLARRGPNRVWQDYRNLRVPVEIFDDVKNYLERRKYEYLARGQGLDEETDISLDEHALAMSSGVQGYIPEMIKQVIQEEFQKIKSGGSLSTLIPQKKSAKERIKELLVANEGDMLTTTQIGDQLSMPAATCRQASRELAQEDDTIYQESGRPNKFVYRSN